MTTRPRTKRQATKKPKPKRIARQTGPSPSLFAGLGKLPDLLGALCAGRHELFDDGRQDYAEAKTICGRCPVFDECRRWAEAHPTKVVGYVAGKLYLHRDDVQRLAAQRRRKQKRERQRARNNVD